MVALKRLVGAAIDAGMSVALQHDAADDVPVIGRQPLPVKGTNVLEALRDVGLNPAEQRQDRRFDLLPFSARQSGHPRQPNIADRTAHPCLQQQEPQRPMLTGGKVERVGKIIPDIEIGVGLVQGVNVRKAHGFRISGPLRLPKKTSIERLLYRRVAHQLCQAGERADHLIGFGAPLRQSFQHPDDPPGFGRREREVFFLMRSCRASTTSSGPGGDFIGFVAPRFRNFLADKMNPTE
jgi:hypothetical protein